ncbi:MAG: hypothetical protein WCT36_03385 [Candidatus Gracilibacteria bacterium]|jgi:hypothetical protein
MFKENRIIFEERAPKEGVEAQSVEVDADLKAIELERFVSRKGELLEKAQRILHKEGATSATKIDELKVLHTGLTKYHDKNKGIKYKGTEADKGRVNAALLEISGVMDEINAEILKLEEPANKDVKDEAKTRLQSLKSDLQKPKAEDLKPAVDKEREAREKPTLSEEEFVSAIKDVYTVPLYPASEFDSRLVPPGATMLKSATNDVEFLDMDVIGDWVGYHYKVDKKTHEEAKNTCTNALIKDIVKATGIKDENAIREVLIHRIGSVEVPSSYTPYAVVDEEQKSSSVKIELTFQGVSLSPSGESTKGQIKLFYKLLEAGLIRKK